MKITKRQLKRIIKSELTRILKEGHLEDAQASLGGPRYWEDEADATKPWPDPEGEERELASWADIDRKGFKYRRLMYMFGTESPTPDQLSEKGYPGMEHFDEETELLLQDSEMRKGSEEEEYRHAPWHT